MKAIFIIFFIAMWVIPLLIQVVLGTLADWVYVDLIFIVLTGNFMYWIYRDISND